MKKFLTLCLLLLVATFAIKAQTVPMMAAGSYEYSYTGKAADTVTVNDTAWTNEFTVNKATPLYYNFACKILKVSAGSCTISLQGRIFGTDEYTNITTYSFAGTQADTIILFPQVSTRQFYRTYRVRVVYVSGKTKVYNIIGYFKY